MFGKVKCQLRPLVLFSLLCLQMAKRGNCKGEKNFQGTIQYPYLVVERGNDDLHQILIFDSYRSGRIYITFSTLGMPKLRFEPGQ